MPPTTTSRPADTDIPAHGATVVVLAPLPTEVRERAKRNAAALFAETVAATGRFAF